MAEQQSEQAILNAVFDTTNQALKTNSMAGDAVNASITNAPFAVNASQLTSPWVTNASIVNVHQVNASQLTSPWITNASVVNSATIVGSAADNAAWSGNPVRVGGVYQSAAQTYTASDVADFQVDVNGRLKTTVDTLISGEDQTNDVLKTEGQFSYANVTASGATAVKTAAGFLHSITFNTAASGVTTVITDSSAAGGTLIGTVAIPAGAVNAVPFTLFYDVKCLSGITASQVSGVATGSNLTVSYR